MAKRKSGARRSKKVARRKARPAGRRAATPRRTGARKSTTATRPAARSVKAKTGAAGRSAKRPRLDRVRRTLAEPVPTPPSSLNMNRHASAVRTGRAETAEARRDHATLTPAITGGDVDVDVENAYFTGDETPGGDNPTPDQDVVDEIGRALGHEYQDSEELDADKVAERDRHRWELDPASSEDYKDRK